MSDDEMRACVAWFESQIRQFGDLHRENARLRKALSDLRGRHQSDGAWHPVCGYCFESWPCGTEEEIRSALDGEGDE